MDRLTQAVARAVQAAPCSVRRLAKAAGVPQPTLVWIVSGKRRATRAVGRKVGKALEAWSGECAKAARRIRQALGRDH